MGSGREQVLWVVNRSGGCLRFLHCSMEVFLRDFFLMDTLPRRLAANGAYFSPRAMHRIPGGCVGVEPSFWMVKFVAWVDERLLLDGVAAA